MAVATIASGRSAATPLPIDRPQVATAFDQLYRGDDALSTTYREGRESRQALLADLDAEMKMANNGAPLPNGFARDAQRLAQVMVRDPRVELAFMAIGGWEYPCQPGRKSGAASPHTWPSLARDCPPCKLDWERPTPTPRSWCCRNLGAR